MSKAGSRHKSTPGSDAERDLLSRENLIRPLTSKEVARLNAFNKTTLQRKVVVPLEKDTPGEEDEGAADDDWIDADL